VRSCARASRCSFEESSLPFHASRFDLIRDADFEPALEEGMRQDLDEIERIVNHTAPPTFENTIVAMKRSGALIQCVMRVFMGLWQANASDALQAVMVKEAPKLAAHLVGADRAHPRVQLLPVVALIVIRIAAAIMTEFREGGAAISARFTGRKVHEQEPVDFEP
jgi:hypothetical protein